MSSSAVAVMGDLALRRCSLNPSQVTASSHSGKGVGVEEALASEGVGVSEGVGFWLRFG
jgi:hypothetical protein